MKSEKLENIEQEFKVACLPFDPIFQNFAKNVNHVMSNNITFIILSIIQVVISFKWIFHASKSMLT